MPALNEETLMENLDFKCERCGAECTKINAAEPEKGYVSKAPGNEGTFVKLCQPCFDEIPDSDKAMRKMPETAFLVVIRGDGEGAYMTTEGVGLVYQREPTFLDVMQGCDRVQKDVEESIFAQKLTNQLVNVMITLQRGNQSPIAIPKQQLKLK